MKSLSRINHWLNHFLHLQKNFGLHFLAGAVVTIVGYGIWQIGVGLLAKSYRDVAWWNLVGKAAQGIRKLTDSYLGPVGDSLSVIGVALMLAGIVYLVLTLSSCIIVLRKRR